MFKSERIADVTAQELAVLDQISRGADGSSIAEFVWNNCLDLGIYTRVTRLLAHNGYEGLANELHAQLFPSRSDY